MADEVQRTRSTYDRVAPVYAERTGEVWPALAKRVDAFRGRVAYGGRVLDVGCGPGRDRRLLEERGLRVVSLDLSLGMLREGGWPASVQADMRSVPVATGRLEGVWTQAALLHVPRSDLSLVLAEVARVLRPGGAFQLTTAGGESEGWEDDVYGPENPRWFVYHSAPGLRAALESAGFIVEEVAEERTNRDWISVLSRLA